MRTPPVDFSLPAPHAGARPGATRPRQTFLQVLGTRDERASPAEVTRPEPGSPAASAQPGAGAGLRTLVARTLRAEAHIDRLLASAAAGKTFSAGELLALQATAFRYSQTVEVLSRAADRLVGSLKQTLGTQV